MSASQKQRISNQKNAQKSTGPKTDSGKTVASKNATKHGLYARDIIINSPHYKEDRTEYELLFESLKSELDPQSQLQAPFDPANITENTKMSKRTHFAVILCRRGDYNEKHDFCMCTLVVKLFEDADC